MPELASSEGTYMSTIGQRDRSRGFTLEVDRMDWFEIVDATTGNIEKDMKKLLGEIGKERE